MNIGLYQSAASLTALERWQDAVTQNITSSQVSGFKKRTVEFSGTEMGEINSGEGRNADIHAGVLPRASFGISFQPGESAPTGRPTDLAIEGEGFFEVKLSSGERAYTRAGEFHTRADHTLVSKEGGVLLSDAGMPITLQPEGGQISVSPDGTVHQGDNQIGKISVVKFSNPAALDQVGGGLFAPKAGVDPIPMEKPVLMQGYLEGSNVTPLREMVALVQIARAYEANQKMISSRDQTLQRTLETLG
jgi:flagellar basal body rod protein FlgG